MSLLDSLALATKGKICGDGLSTIALATKGKICDFIEVDDGLIIEKRPAEGISTGIGSITFPIDGHIQIFVQRGLTKTKRE